MKEARFWAPTYYGTQNEMAGADTVRPEFGEPDVPLLVRTAAGLRILLGSHDYYGPAPDIQIERRPHGWAIFLHPVGLSDASGCVCFLDDGRSYLVPELEIGPTPAIRCIESFDELPELDRPDTGNR